MERIPRGIPTARPIVLDVEFEDGVEDVDEDADEEKGSVLDVCVDCEVGEDDVDVVITAVFNVFDDIEAVEEVIPASAIVETEAVFMENSLLLPIQQDVALLLSVAQQKFPSGQNATTA